MWKRYPIKKNERALLLNEGDFVKVLEPGVFRAFDPFGRLTVQIVPLDAPLADAALADTLRAEAPDVLAQHFDAIDLSDDEAALRYRDGTLIEILPPGTRRLYWWRALAGQRVERIDLRTTYAMPAELAAKLTQPQLRARAVDGTAGVMLAKVPAYHVGVLKIDGRVEQLLEPVRRSKRAITSRIWARSGRCCINRV